MCVTWLKHHSVKKKKIYKRYTWEKLEKFWTEYQNMLNYFNVLTCDDIIVYCSRILFLGYIC